MILRVGIPASFSTFAGVCVTLDQPMLISTGAFYRPGRGLRPPVRPIPGDIALDSAGFVAMVRHGGYPWTVDAYLEVVAARPWTWWASMDCCCEPEIAHDRDEVLRRIDETASRLWECRARAADRGLTPPMPVLQGWNPDDYIRSIDAAGDLSGMVGVGSVCRRHVHGPTGLLAVVDRIYRAAPHLRLHLFGVKGSALPDLAGHPAVASTDSMAWDYAARRECPPPRTNERRASYLRRWISAQRRGLQNVQLHLGLAA